MGRLLFFILSILFLSCSQQESGLEQVPIKDACQSSIFQSEKTYTAAMNLFEAGGMSRLDSMVKADLERIVSWRRSFVRKPTIENLLLFSDSVEHHYTKRSQWRHELSEPMGELKEQLKSSHDSATFYNLLYCATAIEGTLLSLKAAEVGAVLLAEFKVPSYLDKSRYGIGDTVFLTVHTADFYSGDAAFDFSHLTCRNTESGVTLKAKIIKSGPTYILMYLPGACGKYEIEGAFGNKQEDYFGYAFRTRNRFIVTAPD